MIMRKGIDVSSNNHPNNAPIEYADVKADEIEWAAVKFTEGTDYVNPFDAVDAAGFDREGLEVVGYHFARPTLGTGGDNARAFANEAARLDFKGKRALDLEDGRQLGWEVLAGWVKDYVSVDQADLIYAPSSYANGLEPFGWPFGAEEWEIADSGSYPPADAAVTQEDQATINGITGVVDLDTVYYEPAAPPAPEPVVTPPPDVVANVFVPTVHGGASGPAVKAVQALLSAHGGTLAVDGVFGNETATNVIDFQQAKGLTVDGIVGPETWEHLLTT
jgi:Putative peptidoglycan binding domain/Glycosyl hydrolases family 25